MACARSRTRAARVYRQYRAASLYHGSEFGSRAPATDWVLGSEEREAVHYIVAMARSGPRTRGIFIPGFAVCRWGKGAMSLHRVACSLI